MCSVSLSRSGSRLRILMNRDESRSRAPGSAPRLITDGRLARIQTVDGQAGGAWIGVNAAGLVACLLNHTPPDSRPPPGTISRGVIVPQLLVAASVAEAQPLLRPFAVATFAPWTVVLADEGCHAAWRWDGNDLHELPAVRCWSSSGLGDQRVEGPRLAQWQRLCRTLDPEAAQDAWHASREGAEPWTWVLMRRDDARTVSRSEVLVEADGVRLRETLLDENGEAGPSWTLALPCSHSPVSA